MGVHQMFLGSLVLLLAIDLPGSYAFLRGARCARLCSPVAPLCAKSKKGGSKKSSGGAKGGFSAVSSDGKAPQSAGSGANAQAKAEKNFFDLKDGDALLQARMCVRERIDGAAWLPVGRLRVLGGEDRLLEAAQYHKRLLLEHSALKHVSLKGKTNLETGYFIVDSFPEDDDEGKADADVPDNVVACAKVEVMDGLKSGLALDVILAGPMFKRMISSKYGTTTSEMISAASVNKGLDEDENEAKTPDA